MSDSFEKAVKLAIPQKLDELIREKRHLAKLYLSTDAEIAGLTSSIAGVPEVSDQIADWRFITFNSEPSGAQVMLLGQALHRQQTWITSRVAQIDLTKRIVATANSLYGLSGEPGKGEPPVEHLLHICSAFRGWGIGKTLGMLDVFY